MLCSLPGSCLVHPVSFWQWRVVLLWPGDIFNCVSCFLVKKHTAFKWKDAISGFPVSSGSAEPLVRWGGKIWGGKKVHFGCLLSRQHFSQNCRNRTVYVKVIASQRWDVFFEIQCISTYLQQLNQQWCRYLWYHLQNFKTLKYVTITPHIHWVQKKGATMFSPLILPNANRFSNSFHLQTYQ